MCKQNTSAVSALCRQTLLLKIVSTLTLRSSFKFMLVELCWSEDSVQINLSPLKNRKYSFYLLFYGWIFKPLNVYQQSCKYHLRFLLDFTKSGICLSTYQYSTGTIEQKVRDTKLYYKDIYSFLILPLNSKSYGGIVLFKWHFCAFFVL